MPTLAPMLRVSGPFFIRSAVVRRSRLKTGPLVAALRNYPNLFGGFGMLFAYYCYATLPYANLAPALD